MALVGAGNRRRPGPWAGAAAPTAPRRTADKRRRQTPCPAVRLQGRGDDGQHTAARWVGGASSRRGNRRSASTPSATRRSGATRSSCTRRSKAPPTAASAPASAPPRRSRLGLKVDVDALPRRRASTRLKNGTVDLDDPATTLALLQAERGGRPHRRLRRTTARVAGQRTMKSMGIQCALCHSTVDDSFAPGIGHRLDGWPNRDLNVGAIIASRPICRRSASLLGVDQATVRTVLNAWGPGSSTPSCSWTARRFRPDGKTAATLIPPAFGLAGVNLHTWTGWGSVTYWNAFVAILEMHGKGTFFDPRLDDATRFPIAAKNHFGHVAVDEDHDRVTPKLPGLHLYQLRCARRRRRRAASTPPPPRAATSCSAGKAKCTDLPRPAALHRARLEHAHGGGGRRRRLPGLARARRPVPHLAAPRPLHPHQGRLLSRRPLRHACSTWSITTTRCSRSASAIRRRATSSST